MGKWVMLPGSLSEACPPPLWPAGQAATQLWPRLPPRPLLSVLSLSLPHHALEAHRGEDAAG